MKAVVLMASAGLISLGMAATPAAAYHLSPSGPFTADGTTDAVTAAGDLPCKASFTGTVSERGIGQVTGGTFTDNGGPTGFCEAVVLNGLPWKTVAKSAKKVKILNASFSVGGVTCGPSTIPATLRHGVITFTSVPMAGTPSSCSVSGRLKTTPTLSIVP